jgi:hypothetical protein
MTELEAFDILLAPARRMVREMIHDMECAERRGDLLTVRTFESELRQFREACEIVIASGDNRSDTNGASIDR